MVVLIRTRPRILQVFKVIPKEMLGETYHKLREKKSKSMKQQAIDRRGVAVRTAIL
jgi:hypothetical protein